MKLERFRRSALYISYAPVMDKSSEDPSNRKEDIPYTALGNILKTVTATCCYHFMFFSMYNGSHKDVMLPFQI